jgi:hypothetical protein
VIPSDPAPELGFGITFRVISWIECLGALSRRSTNSHERNILAASINALPGTL